MITWRAAELTQAAWTPPACTGWLSSSPSTQVVALAGAFRSEGGMDTLLARIGSISSLRDVRYWSTTEKAWRPMALDAWALSSADPWSRRPDFSASEFSQDSSMYYWMNDYRTGPVVYRMRILERLGEQRVVLGSENVSPVRFLFITLFRPGGVQAVEFIERYGPDLWHFYMLARIDRHASHLVRDQEGSSVNRLVALYRRLANIPTDQEPPAFP